MSCGQLCAGGDCVICLFWSGSALTGSSCTHKVLNKLMSSNFIIL